MLVRVLLVAVPLVVPLAVVLDGCGSGRAAPSGTVTVVPAVGAERGTPSTRSGAETACSAAVRVQVRAGRRGSVPTATGDDEAAYATASRQAWLACATLTVTQARAIRDEVERELPAPQGERALR